MCCGKGRKSRKKTSRPKGTKSGRIIKNKVQVQQQEKNEQRPEDSK